jgi:2-keto-4-pentenoate hydratase/2-oxohepta-3-ene-1,7-dioic acid hydratase in catechol pathway
MPHWVRFEHAGQTRFGQLDGTTVLLHAGEMFGDNRPTGEAVPLAAVRLLTPCTPGKLLALWNNFHERAAKEGLTQPPHPLYFAKSNNSYLACGLTICQPASYDGPVVFEGELGVVIGKTCRAIGPEQADEYVFGYTIVNDVTARDILRADPTFTQWGRAKNFDTFTPIGPVITSGIEPDQLVVRTRVNGVEKQNYPVADMFYRPRQLVSRLSHDMTLEAGDVIACGTSVGAGPMPRGCTVEVEVTGIGLLRNRYE